MQRKLIKAHNNKPNRILEAFIIASGFIIISSILIGYLSDWHPGHNMALNPDSAFMLWSLKWWPHALLSGHNPFHANFFYPEGQNLAWVTAIPTLSLLTAPITWWLGPIFTYNLITIIAISSNAILAYLIARELDCNKFSAIVCALLFYFSSYTWAQLLGHLNLYVTVFAIAAIYLAIRHLNYRRSRFRYIIYMSLLLALQFGVSNEIYTTLIVFAAVAIFIIFIMTFSSKSNHRIIYIFSFETAASIFLSALWMFPYIYQIFLNRVSGLQSISSYVADPLNYLVPTQTNWMLGGWFKDISSNFIGNMSEQGVYLGLPVLVILLTRVKVYRQRLNIFLLTLLVVIATFSLGPRLTIPGVATIPLPWILAEKLPLIKEALPIRFGLYTSLIASVLVARILTNVDNIFVKTMSGLALLLSLPNLAIYKMSPVPSTQFFTSGTYRRVIPAGSTVLILPSYGFWGYQPALWHEKSNFYFNLVDGLAGKIPAKLNQYLWYYYGGSKPDDATFGFLNLIKTTGVNYIISDASSKNPLMTVYRKLDLPYTKYGNIHVVEISSAVRDHLLSEERIKRAHHICTLLIRLSHYGDVYKSDGKNINHLTPDAVKDAEFVKNFGEPLPINSSAANWTSKGYWLGPWGSQVAIGFSPVDHKTANALYRQFKISASKIYFPYPKLFHGQGTPASVGQFLVVLKSDQGSSAKCGGD